MALDQGRAVQNSVQAFDPEDGLVYISLDELNEKFVFQGSLPSALNEPKSPVQKNK